VRLPSAKSAAEAGVVVAGAGSDRMPEGIECLAELSFNQNRVAQITPLAEGVVKSIEVDLGSRVGKGQVLARLASTATSEAQNAYLAAIAEESLRKAALERERSLLAERISSEKEVQEADALHKSAAAALRQARQRLKVLGFTDGQLSGIASAEVAPGDLELRAPFAGEIVERAAVLGSLAEAGAPLFTLADTATLWAMVSIPETRLARARVGQRVLLTIESIPGETFPGRLTWVPAQVDERTRMARARVEVENPDRRLRARMFARALIVTSEADRAIVVPRSAVQSVGGTPLVFVRAGEDLFEARAVRLGARRGERVEVVDGLRVNEPVVVAGGFALKSQLLISRLGAGCVD
jgi:cobalt-zinc-cadmium efflux system membrane fusion protein